MSSWVCVEWVRLTCRHVEALKEAWFVQACRASGGVERVADVVEIEDRAAGVGGGRRVPGEATEDGAEIIQSREVDDELSPLRRQRECRSDRGMSWRRVRVR